MYKRFIVVQLLLVFTLFFSTTAGEQDIFIALVKRGFDVHAVAKDIKRHNDDPDHPWMGSVKKTHPHIGVLLVHGSEDTCNLLTTINGITQCEKDSVVSIAD